MRELSPSRTTETVSNTYDQGADGERIKKTSGPTSPGISAATPSSSSMRSTRQVNGANISMPM
jgi:hypothetical protein